MSKKNFIVQKFESLTDCQIVPRWRVERLAQTYYLRRLFERMGTDCVLDVGANVGQYRDYLRDQIGYSGLIISFEPHPMCITKLQERARHDLKWIIHGHALGASKGTLDFHQTKDSEFSSFLQPEVDRFAGQYIGKFNVVERSAPALVKTLNDIYSDLVGENEFFRPFLKIDTQGFDLQVIRGASEILGKFFAIQSEVSNLPIYEGMPTLAETLNFFDTKGFDLGTFFPANPDQFPVVVDFDTYFIARSDSCHRTRRDQSGQT